MKAAFLSLVTGAVGLTGCPFVDNIIDEAIAKSTKDQLAKISKDADGKLAELSALSAKQGQAIEQLRKDLAAATTDIKKQIETNESWRKIVQDEYKTESASLTADGTGYAIARTSLGPALVKLQGLTPYLDGFKARIWIAALTTVDLSGIKGTLSWIERDVDVLKKNASVFREKEFASTATFQSGRYTEVEVVLTPASASGLKEFYVRLTADQVSVKQPLANPAGR